MVIVLPGQKIHWLKRPGFGGRVVGRTVDVLDAGSFFCDGCVIFGGVLKIGCHTLQLAAFVVESAVGAGRARMFVAATEKKPPLELVKRTVSSVFCRR